MTWVLYADCHWNRARNFSCSCLRTDQHEETNFPKFFYVPVQHSKAHTSRYVGTTGLMHIMIRKCRLEISDKIVGGLRKCFILVSYFILLHSKTSLCYSSDMERSRWLLFVLMDRYTLKTYVGNRH